MLLSLLLVPGRFFRREYINDRLLLLLAALIVRRAVLWVGAAALTPPTARECIAGASGVVTSVVPRADDDATSKFSSSSAWTGGAEGETFVFRARRASVSKCKAHRASMMKVSPHTTVAGTLPILSPRTRDTLTFRFFRGFLSIKRFELRLCTSPQKLDVR